MALEMKYKLAGDFEITAYLRIKNIQIYKENSNYICNFVLDVKSSKESNSLDTWGLSNFKFNYDFKSEDNIIKQIYSYLKTLPEFSEAKDI